MHPLDPLTADEIVACSGTILKRLLQLVINHDAAPSAYKFTYLTLIEPPKLQVLQYLGIPTGTENDYTNNTQSRELPARKAEAVVIDAVKGQSYQIICDLTQEEAQVESIKKLEKLQPGITVEELIEAEEIVRNDPQVQELCEAVGISRDQITADGWSLGWDDRFDMDKRLQQCMMFARFGDDENLYAHPLDFNVVVDSNARKVIAIDFPSHRLSTGLLSNGTSYAPTVSDIIDTLKSSGRDRIPPPLKPFDYLPEEIKKSKPEFELRDVKPLHIIQPEGVSFTIEGNEISWQGWKFHASFHHREGLILSTVTYNDAGKIRPVIYRLSFAEMVVPYSAPEHPHPRKFAFDIGEYGLGNMANSLALGCDCLGTIHYLDGVLCQQNGNAQIIKNAICIHEEDAGLLWKHTDYRANGKSRAVRSRCLIVSLICTVANYEYLFYYKFFQDGTIKVEVKLTGVLNLYVLGEGEPPDYATEVAPRVQAHYHQHIFCLRVDPMIDGIKNSVIQTDIITDAFPTGSVENYAGNAFTTKKTVFKTTDDGAQNWDASKGRYWSIVNPTKKHYASKQPVGFKIMCKDFIPHYQQPDSIVAMRAPFVRKHIWVTPYKDGQLYPAGKFVPQTTSTPEESIVNWVGGSKKIEDEEIAVYLVFGTTHIPRPEDFPVMPVESVELAFKPVGFFEQNPALDVPSAQDGMSKYAFAGAQSTCCS